MFADKEERALVREYLKGGALASIIDYFHKRERDPRNDETRVANLRGQLPVLLDESALADALEILAANGCGEFHKGRPLKNSRLAWTVSAREVAAAIKKESRAEGRNASQIPNGSNSRVEMEHHFFPVRRGVQLEIQLRCDMTAAELNNLADFIRIIAVSRASEEEMRQE